jgi:dipeptidyl aminopeptidase/acylaminoacyl peptidase
MLNLRALLEAPYVEPFTGFDISPDGKKVAFSWNRNGQWEIFEISLIGQQTPRRISIGKGGKFSPKYSPDGSRLAFVVDFDGSEQFHLIILNLKSGQTVDLTPRIRFSLQPNISWSPDGSAIAFLGDENRQFDAFVMGLDKSIQSEQGLRACRQYRRILSINRPAWNINWSPGGRYLAVVFEGPGQDYLTYLVTPDGEESWPITSKGIPIDARNPAWSPDGKRLAFSSDICGWHNIGTLEIDTKEITWFQGNMVERYSPAWSLDGKNLIHVSASGAETWMELWREGNQPLRLQHIVPGTHYSPKFTPDGDCILFVFDNPSHPSDLWQLSLRDRSLRQLTHSLSPILQNSTFIMPNEVIYPSMDGETVPALLYRPKDTNPRTPAVIVIHGGPNWHFSFTWAPFMSYLVSRGWTVLAPNYRGSTGYGRDWQIRNRFDLGGGDADDCAAGAQFLAREKLADPKRIVITGRSHGGYLTMSCLTRHPTLWAGGSAIVPFLNLFNCHAELHEDLKHWDIENMGHPDDNFELWHERSPYFHLDRIQSPVQLICGGNDIRCPASDSMQARDKLIELDHDVDFVIYKDEGHTFLRIENVIDSEVKRAEFIANCFDP